jgi:hypothetical protein
MLNPSAIFRKTSSGVAEISTRALGLRPELRRLLIMIDGTSSVAKLASAAPKGNIDELLDELLALGVIDSAIVGMRLSLTTLEAPAPTPMSAPTVSARMMSAQTQTGSAADATLGNAPSQEQFVAARRAAVRFVNDSLGPSAEAIAIRLERTKTVAELRDAIQAARQSVATARGEALAQRFIETVRAAVAK